MAHATATLCLEPTIMSISGSVAFAIGLYHKKLIVLLPTYMLAQEANGT